MQAKSYRPRQAAEFLGVSVATFWRYAKRPDFPRARRLSQRCTVFDSDEIRQWRDSQQREAA